MFERMLTREVEANADADLLKDDAITMKAVKRILDLEQRAGGDGVAMDEVAEVEKGSDGHDHLVGHMTRNCGKENLKLTYFSNECI